MSDCRTPERCSPANILAFIDAISGALWYAQSHRQDLRIAQIIGNLGDCYNMEDAEYVEWIRDHYNLP